MHLDSAETLSLQALGWLVSIEAPFARFLTLSGLSLSDVRERAGEAEFLAAVMDFVLSDELVAKGFCEATGIDPAMLQDARRALPGAAPE